MARRRQPLDGLMLAGREVDAVEEDQRELVGMLGDGRLQVVGPDGILAGPRPDDDQVRRRIEAALGEVAMVTRSVIGVATVAPYSAPGDDG